MDILLVGSKVRDTAGLAKVAEQSQEQPAYSPEMHVKWHVPDGVEEDSKGEAFALLCHRHIGDAMGILNV